MLAPATKRWEDISTAEHFRFLFYCDCCKKEIPSPIYTFENKFRPKLFLTRSERQARAMIWQRDHEAAYERANLYMLSNRIHTCEICGANICDDCACVCDELNGGVCCEACLREHQYHGIKLWGGD